MKRTILVAIATALLLSLSGGSWAQVPVIDDATLKQATQTASNTASIMQSNQSILQTVNQTLAAVTGNRSTGSLSSIGLGSGFSMSSVPDLSSLLGGGSLSMGSLGQYGQTATQIINGLNLVKTLSGASSAAGSTDQAYVGAVNTVATLTAAISGAQAASSTQASAFTGANALVGTAPDIKGSIDQNSQLTAQVGQTINQLISTVNLTNAALNAQQQQDLAAQSKLSNMVSFDASSATLIGR